MLAIERVPARASMSEWFSHRQQHGLFVVVCEIDHHAGDGSFQDGAPPKLVDLTQNWARAKMWSGGYDPLLRTVSGDRHTD